MSIAAARLRDILLSPRPGPQGPAPADAGFAIVSLRAATSAQALAAARTRRCEDSREDG